MTERPITILGRLKRIRDLHRVPCTCLECDSYREIKRLEGEVERLEQAIVEHARKCGQRGGGFTTSPAMGGVSGNPYNAGQGGGGGAGAGGIVVTRVANNSMNWKGS